MFVYRLGLAEFAHAKSASENDLAAVNQRKRGTGNVEFLHGSFDEGFDLGDVGSIQGLRLTSGKGLALIALWAQALHDQRNRRMALLERRFACIQDDHSPRISGAH